MSWPLGIGSPEVYLFTDFLKNPSIMPLGIFLGFLGGFSQKSGDKDEWCLFYSEKLYQLYQMFVDFVNQLHSFQFH